MSYLLLVVDMQASFYTANGERIQKNCIREINKAIKDKAHIVFVEYEHHGPTLSRLTEVVQQAHYRKVHCILKAGDDGSYEIREYLLARHLPRLSFRVCGVNTNWCVLSTVAGLREIIPNSQIKIVADACACHSTKSHTTGLSCLKKMDNTRVLRAPRLNK
jgi:nicotinamidase-related amidase